MKILLMEKFDGRLGSFSGGGLGRDPNFELEFTTGGIIDKEGLTDSILGLYHGSYQQSTGNGVKLFFNNFTFDSNKRYSLRLNGFKLWAHRHTGSATREHYFKIFGEFAANSTLVNATSSYPFPDNIFSMNVDEEVNVEVTQIDGILTFYRDGFPLKEISGNMNRELLDIYVRSTSANLIDLKFYLKELVLVELPDNKSRLGDVKINIGRPVFSSGRQPSDGPYHQDDPAGSQFSTLTTEESKFKLEIDDGGEVLGGELRLSLLSDTIDKCEIELKKSDNVLATITKVNLPALPSRDSSCIQIALSELEDLSDVELSIIGLE